MSAKYKYSKETKKIIKKILKDHPRLTIRGYDGNPFDPKYSDLRNQLLKQSEQFYIAYNFMINQKISTTKTYCKTGSINSYSLKHRMENPTGKDYQGYVANGMAILVSLFLGFPIQGYPDEINVQVKMVNK